METAAQTQVSFPKHYINPPQDFEEAFQRCWTMAVGQPNYNKEEWIQRHKYLTNKVKEGTSK